MKRLLDRQNSEYGGFVQVYGNVNCTRRGTDISNKEQVVICFRWVDKQLEAHEEFTSIYLVESTQASVLHSVIRDVLQRFNLTITKLRGQYYDCAASMSGIRSGVAKKILKGKNPEQSPLIIMGMPSILHVQMLLRVAN